MAKNQKNKTPFRPSPASLGSPPVSDTCSGQPFRPSIVVPPGALSTNFPFISTAAPVPGSVSGKAFSFALDPSCLGCLKTPVVDNIVISGNDVDIEKINLAKQILVGSLDQDRSFPVLNTHIVTSGTVLQTDTNCSPLRNDPLFEDIGIGKSAPKRNYIHAAETDPIIVSDHVANSGSPTLCDATPSSIPTLKDSDPVPAKSWTSLFSGKPRNAGDYSPRKFDIKCVDGVMIPPAEVIDAGTLFWKDQLVVAQPPEALLETQKQNYYEI